MSYDVTRTRPKRVEIYDTTLRDGSQLEGISLTVEDKLRIAEQLDWLGVALHRGGLAGREPEGRRVLPAGADRAEARRRRRSSRSARPGGSRARSTATTRCATSSRPNVGTVCIVGKSWDYHVTEALGTTLDEGVAMVADSVEFLRGARACDVLFDAEHFFDGYKRNPEFALRVLEAAVDEGREPRSCCATPTAARCRTRSSRSSREVVALLRRRRERRASTCHDDAGTGVANALAGVRGGATQVQGTINGYGERTGNCNLTTIIPNLTLKMGIETIPRDRLERLTPVAHHVAELVNMPLNPQAPYVGHVGVRAQGRAAHRARSRSGPTRTSTSSPDVGRQRHALRRVGARRASRRSSSRPRSSGSTLDGPQLAEVVDTLKRLEHEGYHFEVADGSLELLMRRGRGMGAGAGSEVESFRVITDDARRRHAHRRDRRDRHDRGDRQGARRRRARRSRPPRATVR